MTFTATAVVSPSEMSALRWKMQYKQLCADCAAEMMKGSGHGGKIPDFTGTDMTFHVKDPALKGGGFVDSLSNTWQKVKTFVSESPRPARVSHATGVGCKRGVVRRGGAARHAPGSTRE
eukprot:COSAG02_NODE_142_length_34188_cov_183.180791_21_plen_119_part_00